MARKTVNMEDMTDIIEGCLIDDLPDVESWIPTGCTLLDLSISNSLDGGIPLGRIIQIYGGSATCKSVLMNTILGYALRGGKLGFLADIEHALDPRYAKLFGLDVDHDNFRCGTMSSLEEMFDKWIGGIIKKYEDQPKLLGVDSITALPSCQELDKDMSDGQSRAPRAKAISAGLRKYIKNLSYTNTTLFCIDQTRQNITGYGESEVTTGGMGMEFYSSVRIYLKHEGDIKTSSGQNIGIWVRFTIKKNRVAPPMRIGHFKLLYDYGIDDISSNLRFLAENRGTMNEDGTWNKKSQAKDGRQVMSMVTIVIPQEDGGDPLPETYTIKKWVREIENRGLEKVLKQNVLDTWKECHRTEQRKPRFDA